MANIEERTLTLVYGTTKNYFSGSGLYIDYQGWSQQPMAIWGSRNGTATMKDAGKAVLYPKAGIHPFKADLSMIGATSVDDAVMKIYFDDVLVFDDWWYNDSQEETKLVTNITDPAILNSTINSSITVNLSASQTKLFGGFGMRNNSYFKLYFQQWDLIAEKIGDGDSLLFSPGRLYEGESATFSALVNQNSTWHGWYSDIAHTQLLSTDLNYTTTASQDLTIYGYSTKNNGLYNDLYYCSEIKNCEKNKNNSYDLVYKYYIKTLNGWELQTSSANFNKNQNYNLKKRQPIYRTLSNLSNTTTHTLSTVRNYQIYYDFINQEEYYIQSITLNISSPLTDIIIPKNKGFWCQVKNNISITINYFNSINFNIITKTLTYAQTAGAYLGQIQIKDENDNISKTTFQAASGYTVSNNITGLKEIYNGTPTGRILQSGQTYYDVCDKPTLYYEYINNE